MTLGERIRDTLAQRAPLSVAEIAQALGIKPTHAGKALRLQRDAGVIVPLPGRYPRRYRLPLEVTCASACR